MNIKPIKVDLLKNLLIAPAGKTGMSLFKNKKTHIILGGSGIGRSYSPLFIKHNLIGKNYKELKNSLQEIIKDETMDQREIVKLSK
ncbi:hypothetical protein [Chryseobacterium sp. 18068]|uniref:hypothetical protein n=1 Tax=Chryseobacterium sp. 18068 TaxID=2681414 RepID=UPI001356D30F|nr:hypothetical protein [Chryseobacterium sp. 18068]